MIEAETGALARKLLIALWRFGTTGETLEGVILHGSRGAFARVKAAYVAPRPARALLSLGARLKCRCFIAASGAGATFQGRSARWPAAQAFWARDHRWVITDNVHQR
jgi:hypothetical protein